MPFREWLYTVPLRVRTLFRRNRVEDELAEELRFHLDHEIEAGVARGLTADAARLSALRRLDGIEQRKEECRDTWRVRWLDGLIQDLNAVEPGRIRGHPQRSPNLGDLCGLPEDSPRIGPGDPHRHD